jgi:hypothetical protein
MYLDQLHLILLQYVYYVSSLNVFGKSIGSGIALTNLNYGSVNNAPDLTVCDEWTKSGNNLYNTTNESLGIGVNNPTGQFEVFTYSNSARGSATSSKIGHESRWSPNQIFCTAFNRFMTSWASSDEIAFFGYVEVMII